MPEVRSVNHGGCAAMKQQYGRTTTGRVRHIVRTEKGIREGQYYRALCGRMAQVVPLVYTVGDTCGNCLKHPEFNQYDETGGVMR